MFGKLKRVSANIPLSELNKTGSCVSQTTARKAPKNGHFFEDAGGFGNAGDWFPAVTKIIGIVNRAGIQLRQPDGAAMPPSSNLK